MDREGVERVYPVPPTPHLLPHPQFDNQHSIHYRRMPADKSQKKSLPFEPKPNKSSSKPTAKSSKQQPIVKPKTADQRPDNSSRNVPEVVSQRMIKRVAFFSGIPAIMGMAVFIVSYILVSQHITKLPNVAVLLASMACLGLSVLGLSYGILSASWEEAADAKGSLLGVSEFRVNFSRMLGAYKASKAVDN
jgi:hypothetical protein